MRANDFGEALRSLIGMLARGDSPTRWFSKHLGLDDRYMRRWQSGECLPSDDSWNYVVDTLKKKYANDGTILLKLQEVESLLARARGRIDYLKEGELTGRKELRSSIQGVLSLHDECPAEYAEWIIGVAQSLGVSLEVRPVAKAPLQCTLLMIWCNCDADLTRTVLARRMGEYSVPGRTIALLAGPRRTTQRPRLPKDLVCRLTCETADDLVPLITVVDYARRNVLAESESAQLSGCAIPGYVCVRKTAHIELEVSHDCTITTATFEIQSLVDRLDMLHHGLVIPDRTMSIDMATSCVSVSTPDPLHKLLLDDVLIGKRTFQFSFRIRPPLVRGQTLSYQYRTVSPNVYPLSQSDILKRMREGNYHLQRNLCEKAYTVTTPTNELMLRISLPKDIPRVSEATVEVVSWKSETPDTAETRRVLMQNAVTCRSVNGRDEILLHVKGPQLFARYRLFWRYVM